MGMNPTVFSVSVLQSSLASGSKEHAVCLILKDLHQIANDFIIKCFWEVSADLLRFCEIA